MKDIEEQIKSALFRERSIREHNYDPGPNWQEEDLVITVIKFITAMIVMYCFLSS